MDKFRQVEEDIRKVIAGCPPSAKRRDIIAAVCRHVRIKKETIKNFL